jgi:protein-S-isoprenylcysteine O-methyltransferase Ste14
VARGALGVALVVTGSVLALRAAVLLAGRGRPRRGPQPEFVIAGPYRRARNPLLGGAIVALTGATLLAASWRAGTAAFVAAAALAHLWVRGVEEPRLRARFGAAYAEYLRRVPRWLPRRAKGGSQPTGST